MLPVRYECEARAGLGGIDGAGLRAARETCGWEIADLATQMIGAANEIQVPVARHHGLCRMIRSWEKDIHKPRERYVLLYRRLGLLQANGTAAPRAPQDDLAGLASHLRQRADAMRAGPAQITALETAALARVPEKQAGEICALAQAAMEDLEEFHRKLKLITEALEGGALDE